MARGVALATRPPARLPTCPATLPTNPHQCTTAPAHLKAAKGLGEQVGQQGGAHALPRALEVLFEDLQAA